jgi:hypothetical protein
MEALANIMYAVGVGQIRNEDEAHKLYQRYVMLRVARNDIESTISLFPLSMIKRYIGAHTNVSDVSDFQFNKSLIAELSHTADLNLSRAIREGI